MPGKISLSPVEEILELRHQIEKHNYQYHVLDAPQISDSEYDRVMAEPPRLWTEFPTYKKRFERWRPVFKMLDDRGLVDLDVAAIEAAMKG